MRSSRAGSAQHHQLSRPQPHRPDWQIQLIRHASRRAQNRGERFWVPDLDLRCRRWHPAKTPGVLRIASSVLHILSQTTSAPYSGAPEARGRKAAQEHFSEENFRTHLQSGNVFLKSPTGKPHTAAGNSRHTASLDELAEPNYYSNSGETSSTHVFASQLPGSKLS
jgi:hypothetical protein